MFKTHMDIEVVEKLYQFYLQQCRAGVFLFVFSMSD